MKGGFKKVLIVIILVFVTGWLAVTGISELVNKKDLKTVKIVYAVEILEVRHSINFIIPMGKEHYYLGAEDGTDKVYVIRATKGWLDKNFNSDHYARDAEGLTVTGLTKRVSHKFTGKINSTLSELEGFENGLGKDMFLDLKYKIQAVVKVLGALLVAGVAVLIAFGNKKETPKEDPPRVIIPEQDENF